MQQIRSKDTEIEVLLRKTLWKKGYRYRKNDKRLPGKPDIVLPKYRSVVFVNGCFWHKHEGCKYFVWPKSNVDFWKEKIKRNVERDLRQWNQLQSLGWNVIVVWECELKKDCFEKTMKSLEYRIKNHT